MPLHLPPPRSFLVRLGHRLLLSPIVTLGLLVSGPAARPQGVQPLLRYTFDEEGNPAHDDGTLGSSYDGSIAGSSWLFVAQGSGHALSLQESTSVTPLGASGAFDFPGSFAIHARVRLESALGTTNRVIAAKRDAGGRGYALCMDPASGRAVFELEGNDSVEVSSTWRVDDSALHDLLGVRDGAQLKLYVDGVLNTTAAVPSALGSTSSTRAFRIGHPTSGGQTGFRGVLDELAVYDRAVTPADVGGGPDCNENGIEDGIEIAAGDAADCNGDGIPDACQGGSAGGDCNDNGICDVQELALGLVPDVNLNGVPDDCESWHALPFGCNSVLVFGDSLSDTGNFYAGSGHPQSPPNWQGRFSNGPVWIEYLTGFLGIPESAVLNFAFGGATSGNTNVSSPIAPGLTQELQVFQDALNAGYVPTERTLFVLWIGGNDFWANQQLLPTVPDAIANIEAALRTLVAAGARHILVPNLPDLGATPVAHSFNDPDKVTAARMGTIGFNANLAELLARLEHQLDVDLILFDAFGLNERILQDPAAFGLVETQEPCLDEVTGIACADSGTHLFWDRVHPTTNAHRRIALAAEESLLDGGVPLPLPLYAGGGKVQILGPSMGSFPTLSSVTVNGRVDVRGVRTTTLGAGSGPPGPLAQLDVNGIDVPFDASGRFTVDVPLSSGQIENPIVATLRSGASMIDHDRIVVFQGEPLDSQTAVVDALVARLTPEGIGTLNDEVVGQLILDDVLDLQSALLESNPLSGDYGGGFQFVINATGAGYGCASFEIVAQNRRLYVRGALHDLWIAYHFDPTVGGPFDFVPDCDGILRAARVSFWTELAPSPASGAPGEVRVRQLRPLQFDLMTFDHDGECAAASEFLDLIPGVDIDVEVKVRSAISNKLRDLDQSSALSEKLEEILAAISISGAVSDGIGVTVQGDIDTIDIHPQGVELRFSAGISPASGPSTALTYAVPTGALPPFGTDPIGGAPYRFAISVALRTLNQLLLARPDLMPQGMLIDRMDFGSGPEPITAGHLAALLPAFARFAPATPMEVRVDSTLPPMLLGQAPGSTSLSDVYVGQLLLSVAPAGGAPCLVIALDLRGGLSMEYVPSTSSLAVTLGLAPDDQATTVLTNSLHVEEGALGTLLESLVPVLMANAGPATAVFPLPGLQGMPMAVDSISSQNGYITVVLDLGTNFPRPDLVVESIDPLGTIDVNAPFTVQGRITNIGTDDARGSVFVGVSLSQDGLFMNGDDVGLQQVLVNLDGLRPGATKSFVIPNNVIPPQPFGQKMLFVLADVPFLPGGTGAICERTETNNHLGLPILATAPDAFVTSVTPPENLVGAVGSPASRIWTCHVGRNDVGPDVLYVPVGIVVGTPGSQTSGGVTVALARGAEMDVAVSVPTPFSNGSAGQINYVPVTACANLASDGDRQNDCVQSTAAIAVPWWDLRFSIVNAPSSATHCQSTHWDVRVTNVGNIASPNVCAITGITRFPGSSGTNHWGSNLGIFNFTTPNIAPGGSWTHHVSNYFVNCGAALGTQYIKTEVNYSGGCFDNYSAGNFDQEAISIN